MRSEVPVQPPKTANAGPGKTPSGTGCAPKPWSRSSRNRRLPRVQGGSHRDYEPGPPSSGSWCCGWHRCYGGCGAPPQSRPNCFGSKAEISRDLKVSRGPSWRITTTPGFANQPSSGDHADQVTTDCCNVYQGMWGGPDGPSQPASPSRELAYCFLRLVNIDSGVFERLGRYEFALSRQMFRTLVLLKSARTP